MTSETTKPVESSTELRFRLIDQGWSSDVAVAVEHLARRIMLDFGALGLQYVSTNDVRNVLLSKMQDFKDQFHAR
jgi:hypothetical protein